MTRHPWRDPVPEFGDGLDDETERLSHAKVMGRLRLAVADRITGLIAHPGEGKTTLAVAISVDMLRDGQPVLFCDGDNRRDDIVARFRHVGISSFALRNLTICPEGDLREFVRAWDMPPREPDPDEVSEREWERRIKEYRNRQRRIEEFRAKYLRFKALVVVDGYRGFLRMAGINNANNAWKFSQFFLPELRGEWAAVLVTDHPLRREVAVPRARAGLEEALDVSWHLSKVEPFGPSQAGLIRARRGKDGVGRFPEGDRAYRVVPDEEGHVRVFEAPTGDRAVAEAIMELVGHSPFQLTASQIDRAVRKRVVMTTENAAERVRSLLLSRGQLVVEKREREEQSRVEGTTREARREVYGLGAAS